MNKVEKNNPLISPKQNNINQESECIKEYNQENINSNDILSTTDNSSLNNQSIYIANKRGRNSSPLKENKVTLSKQPSKLIPKNKYINDFFKPAASIIYNQPVQENDNKISHYINELSEKEKEISFLKNELTLLQNKLEETNESHFKENELSNKIIINLLKELEEQKRKDKKKYLHEQQIKIGKFSLIRTARGQYIDLWEDGEEVSSIKQKIKQVKESKNNLMKNNQNKSFEFFSLQREEKILEAQYENLDYQKIQYLLETRNYAEEANCYYCKTWPLLNQRYQLLNLLGKGGYSEVYKAFDIKTKQYVACKVYLLKQNWSKEICENYIKHTFREIEIHKMIECSKIIKQLDVFDIDGTSYCTVLEYCNGSDLGTYMKLNKILSEKEVQNITRQILVGLDYLSQQKKKIIHYDLKPQNILFHNKEVKISDFGISKIIDSDNSVNTNNIELTSQGIGTYYYLPPECFEIGKATKINNKVDIWSVGVMCYEMLFGKKPFGQGCSQEKLFDIMSELRKVSFPMLPKISEECKEFIMKCLEWKIESRFDVSQALHSKFMNKEYFDNINECN